MEIDSKALTNCRISPDGQEISFGFVDASGQPTLVRMPVEQVGALAMTLPALIEQALRKRFGDDTLRYTFPLANWKVERSSDPATSIVTFGTQDGFSVCFSVPRVMQDELSEALGTSPVAAAYVVN